MSRFDLLYDVKAALGRTVSLDSLVAAVFREDSELQEFHFDVTSEYDDNNYSDYTRLTYVNGHHVDYDYEYDEDDLSAEGEEDNPLPKVGKETMNKIALLGDEIRERFGYGEQKFSRSDYEHGSGELKLDADTICALSILKGESVPVDTLLEASARWVLHNARLQGRYSEEDEFRLMARKEMIHVARVYAEEHGPLSDKTLNFFVLSLTSDDYEYEQLQSYLDWLRGKAA